MYPTMYVLGANISHFKRYVHNSVHHELATFRLCQYFVAMPFPNAFWRFSPSGMVAWPLRNAKSAKGHCYQEKA